ncbi:glucosyltransferase domain-containing protein [uncultured Gimesia sp.]|uniref:glucosyltransferase domain-containing protein n=2 Tax=Gimesia TaxID=1649453 RepID=UPI0030DAEDC4
MSDNMSENQPLLIKWIKKERYWLSYLLVLCCFSFTYELFNFTLSIDEENYAERLRPDVSHYLDWVEQGRWSMYLLNYLYPANPIIPFAPFFFSLVCSALSFSLIVRILSSERTVRDYIAAPLFMACPTLYYIYSFNTLNYGVGIGFLTGALSVYIFIFWRGKINWLISVLLIAFTIGVYQAFLPWLITLCCFSILRECIEDRIDVKQKFHSLLSFLFFVGSGFIVYYLFLYVFRFYLNIEPDEYIDSFVRFQFSYEYISQTASNIISSMKNTYLGRDDIYDQNIYSLFFVFTLAVSVVLFQILHKSSSFASKLTGLMLLFLIVSAPFSLNLLNEGVMPTRALLAVPLVLSGLVFLSLSISSQAIRALIILGVVTTLFQFISINNRFAFSDYITWQADRSLSIRILNRIDELDYGPNVRPTDKKAYALVGHITREKYSLIVEKESLGASFYSWDQGSVHRVLSMMRSMGVDEFRPATLEEQRSIMQYADRMPVWPANGSVALKNGITIVKLGPYSSPQLSMLCTDEIPCAMCRVQYNPGFGGIRIIEPDTEIDKSELIFDLKTDLDQVRFVNSTGKLEQDQVTVNVRNVPGQIYIPSLKADGGDTVFLRCDMSSPADTTLFFFYRYKNQAEYVARNQLQIKLNQGMNHLLFSIPGDLLKESLRIDPGFEPGIYKIKHLEMYKQNENPL